MYLLYLFLFLLCSLRSDVSILRAASRAKVMDFCIPSSACISVRIFTHFRGARYCLFSVNAHCVRMLDCSCLGRRAAWQEAALVAMDRVGQLGRNHLLVLASPTLPCQQLHKHRRWGFLRQGYIRLYNRGYLWHDFISLHPRSARQPPSSLSYLPTANAWDSTTTTDPTDQGHRAPLGTSRGPDGRTRRPSRQPHPAAADPFCIRTGTHLLISIIAPIHSLYEWYAIRYTMIPNPSELSLAGATVRFHNLILVLRLLPWHYFCFHTTFSSRDPPSSDSQSSAHSGYLQDQIPPCPESMLVIMQQHVQRLQHDLQQLQTQIDRQTSPPCTWGQLLDRVQALLQQHQQHTKQLSPSFNTTNANTRTNASVAKTSHDEHVRDDIQLALELLQRQIQAQRQWQHHHRNDASSAPSSLPLLVSRLRSFVHQIDARTQIPSWQDVSTHQDNGFVIVEPRHIYAEGMEAVANTRESGNVVALWLQARDLLVSVIRAVDQVLSSAQEA